MNNPWIHPAILKKIFKEFRLAGNRRAAEDRDKVNAATAKGQLAKLDAVVILRHFNGEQS